MNNHHLPNNSPLLPVLCIQTTHEVAAFIEAWEKLYNYPGWDTFEVLIQKKQLTKPELLELFHWKNNMILSGLKSNSFESKIAAQLSLINELKLNFDREKFNAAFGRIRAVWQTFLLHIIHPGFPIFDQHVYRAFHFLTYRALAELPTYQPACMSIYDEHYVPFFRELQRHTSKHSSYEIDHALWAFGRFLKEYPAVVVTDVTHDPSKFPGV